MLATSIRWADEATWLLVVLALALAMLLPRCTKLLWRWFRRQRAEGWPTVQGRIESTEVKTLARAGLLAYLGSYRWGYYQAELAYSYSLEGHYYSGYYQREFPTKKVAGDFVRDLRSRPVFVSYNPRQPAKSQLLEDAVSTLLSTRKPKPD